MQENIYRDALDILRNEGWSRVARETDDGYCLIGALEKAKFGFCDAREHDDLPHDPYNMEEVSVLRKVIQDQYGPDIYSVDHWNDHQATFPDVERVLEKAAVAYDEQI